MKITCIIIGIVALPFIAKHIFNKYIEYRKQVKRNRWKYEREQLKLEKKLASEREDKKLSTLTSEERSKYARKQLKNFGMIRMSYYGMDCEKYLQIIGVDIELVKTYLRQIDYLSCSIKYDGEYYLSKDLHEENEALIKYLKPFKIKYDTNWNNYTE
tara:strand:- start:16309 stop:16779 length:471 start_codon:yes stop_codon:yes gene_type:complete